jgi:MEMO1 family protein
MYQSKEHVSIAVLMPHAPVLVPAVGGRRGNQAAASVAAMAEAARRLVKAGPEAVVVISPHAPRRRGAFGIWARVRVSGSLAQFGAPEVTVDLPADETLAEMIAGEAGLLGLKTWQLRDSLPETAPAPSPADAGVDISRGSPREIASASSPADAGVDISRGKELDHGALVPLWHLAEAGWRGPTVVMGLNYPGEGGLAEMGAAIAAAGRRAGRRLAVLASGDMSHRLQAGAPAGFHPRATEFDGAFIECLRAGDYRKLQNFDPELQELAAEDVVDSTVMAAAAAKWDAAGHEVLSYEGPFGVGYGVAILHQAPPETAQTGDKAASRQGLAWVAWRSIEAALRGGEGRPEMAAEGILGERHGVFVTICGRDRELRGCVGTLKPKFGNLVEETWQVARDAAFRDGRFAPVGMEELAELHCEVSVILGLEEVASPAELDAARYGVVVTADDGRHGVLLPAIPGIGTVEEQLAIARRKGGIGGFEPVRLQRFAVKKFGAIN